MLIIGDPRRFSLAPPVMDIEEHELAEEKLATRARGGVEKRFDLRAARRLPGVSKPSQIWSIRQSCESVTPS